MPRISLSLNIENIPFKELSAAPDTPDSGYWRLYLKSTGLFIVDDSGTEHGPLGAPNTLSLDDLSDVDTAATTLNYVLAVNDAQNAYEGRLLTAAHIPNLPGSKITSSVVGAVVGGTGVNASAYEGLIRFSGGVALELKSEFDAAVPPTTGDDENDGYAVGSRWIDTTAGKEYVCVDASAGAALWIETTASGGGGGGGADDDSRALIALGW